MDIVSRYVNVNVMLTLCLTVADVLLPHPASEKRYYSVQFSGQIGIIKYKIY